MEVKVTCACGSRYKFDVEPINNRMPTAVQCPTCGADGTASANAIIASQSVAQPTPTPVPVALRVSGTHSGGGLALAEAPPVAYSAAADERSLLERTSYFIRERAAVLKLTDTYDILDPMTQQIIGIAKEEPAAWAKWLRLVIKKHQMPTRVNIYEVDGHPPVLSMYRGFTFLHSKVRVIAGDGTSLGYFKSKLFSIGGGFNVFDNADQQVAQVKGNWKGWDFQFLNQQGREIGKVTKKWAGLGKELFTSADNYIITINDDGGANQAASALLLAAGLAIDVVFKEGD
jgi:uncharacterized protein YxjI